MRSARWIAVGVTRVHWLGLGVALIAWGPVEAATHTWTGSGATPNWSDVGNWVGGVPVNDPSGLNLVFPADAPGPHAMVQDIADLDIQSISINSLESSPPYTLNGSGFTLGGSVTSVVGRHELHVPIVLGADLAMQTGAPFLGEVLFLGPISGPHGILQGGFLTLAGDNSFTGTVTGKHGGRLTVRSPHALGSSGAGTAVSGELRFEDYVFDPSQIEDIQLTGENLRITGAGTNVLENLSIGPSVIGVAMELDPDCRLDVGRLGGTNDFLQMVSPGATMRILGASTFPGLLEVRAGTLVVNGAAPLAEFRLDPVPGEQSVLRGSGTTGRLTVVNGELSPGDPQGTLTVNGDLSLFGSSVLRAELGPDVPGSDRIIVTGSVGLGNASLALTRSFLPPIGTVFTLISHSGVQVGQFAGLPSGATVLVMGQSYRIDYLSTSITLTALDELPVELDTFVIE